jgi:hypothetical protein
MASNKPPTPTSLARAERQRVAAEEGVRAMADVERKAVDVRKNMERLRALRTAQEAEDAKTQPPVPAKKKRKKKAGVQA